MSLPSASAVIRDGASGRRSPGRARSFWVSAACMVLGLVLFGLDMGQLLTQYNDSLPHAVDVRLAIDAAAGFVAALAIGPAYRADRWNLLFVPLLLTDWGMAAAGVALVRIGAMRSRRLTASALALTLLGGAAFTSLSLFEPDTTPTQLLGIVPMMTVLAVPLLAWGYSRGARRAELASLQARAEAGEQMRLAYERERAALARGRTADIARAQAEQRTALARDMHDSLSHHLSLIAMHAGALAYREDLTPEQVRSTARTLRDSAGVAGAELREVLTALRDDTRPSGARPLPDATSLLTLVDSARTQGQHVDLAFEGMPSERVDALTPAGVVSVTRMASELLANARRHAPGLPVRVVVSDDGDALRLTVSNPLPSPEMDAAAGTASDTASGAGLGLIGVAERARILGGSAESGTRAGEFVVKVRVPWQR